MLLTDTSNILVVCNMIKSMKPNKLRFKMLNNTFLLTFLYEIIARLEFSSLHHENIDYVRSNLISSSILFLSAYTLESKAEK